MQQATRSLPFTMRPQKQKIANAPRRRFDPTSWSGALVLIALFAAVLWAVQIVNAHDDYRLDRFGLRPRTASGLWGVLDQPFLHQSYGHLWSNTLPLVAIGWMLMLSGIRAWLFVTASVIVLGGFATWLVAPSGQLIVGASGLVFGWLGYLLARAYFSRRFKWIVMAVALLVFFGTLLGSLLPSVDSSVSWQSHLCGALTGVGVAWFLHPRKAPAAGRRRGAPVR